MRRKGLLSAHVPVLRPHRVHIRTFPWWCQGVRGASVEAFVEVAVDVEDRADAGVFEPGGDDGAAGADHR